MGGNYFGTPTYLGEGAVALLAVFSGRKFGNKSELGTKKESLAVSQPRFLPLLCRVLCLPCNEPYRVLVLSRRGFNPLLREIPQCTLGLLQPETQFPPRAFQSGSILGGCSAKKKEAAAAQCA